MIPVFNHAATIDGVISGALATGLPVLVVDDGSTDGSGAIAAAHDGVKVLNHPQNLGKGAAIVSGLKAAEGRYDQIITLDADGQHDPADIPALLAAESGDSPVIVVGERIGMYAPEVPRGSRVGRSFSNFWVHVCGGIKVADSQTGFRLYPVRETLELAARGRRFQFEVEILALAGWKGLPVRNAPVNVTYQARGQRISHFRPFIDFMRNSAVFSSLLIRRLLIPRPLRRRWWCSERSTTGED